ncbi:MAG: magnesium/cobalt transporter CorA [Sulfuricaulis sp.]|uniref:magnesium/cobalt transporter CorA n=1 Tax=Sulfuricaulis sp. TaxID=2003553 RepID=UPI0025D306B0|nr:magnesium/cobalt transporter CorA [Sulfuricaulis sp.]MCR4346864.1 magnesium/cobalt transporter CorA [Sulfuricaulis sp.]
MTRLVQKRSRKTGLPPGTAVHIGEKKSEQTRIQLLHYDAVQVTERELEDIEDGESLRPGTGVTWVHVTGVHDVALLDKIGRGFGLHPLVLEDISNTDQRPKFEDYGDYIYVVLKMLHDGPSSRDIEAEQVSVIFGKDFVLSFEEAEPTVFDPVRERIRAGRARVRERGADYLAYSLLDAVVDNYFSLLEQVGERMELLQDELLTLPTPRMQQSLHRLRREMVLLRKSVWPLREVLSGLERGRSGLIREDTYIYLRDVYDHTVHVIDTIETFRDMIGGLMDIYLMSLSNRMNEIMKVLTIIATIFMPLSFIASLYGMNFRHMPELDWPWGYPLVLLLMVAVTGGLLLFFRRKKWI